MLSLAKLAGSNQRYYLEQAERRFDHAESVSSGAEDYYLSGPEATGRWTGSASSALGLRGDVSDEALRAVLSRQHPETGATLPGSVSRARVPGFDLMFSVPKSASIVFGIGDAETQKAVLDAQMAAVDVALKYLEEHACRTRRGPGGCEIVVGQGFVGAAFRHRTSRAGDPQVHTHVLIANATRVHDETWGSLDGRVIYAEARTAGFIHEAVFRRELTQRLGVEWTNTRNGIAEIEGVPRDAIEAFSRRKAEIDGQVGEWGIDTAQARQSAAVQTRRRKDYEVTPDQLAPEWRARAASLGLDDDRLHGLFGRREPAEPFSEDLLDRLASEEGVTAQRSMFDRRDVVRAVAESARDGATLGQIEGAVAAFLSESAVVTLGDDGGRSEDVIRLRDGRVVSAVVDSPRYSTAELLSVEQRVVAAAAAAVGAGAGVADAHAVERALAERPTVGEDQRRMVERLCLSGEGVQIVVGPPGTGKTFALAAAREAWQASGFTVYGAALARRAALELSSSAGIESTSLAALFEELRGGTTSLLDEGTVLVVDEAAMVGTRQLAELVDRTRAAGAKLVLVGDHAQLPEIDAGGAFRALVARTSPVVLETNRRQARGDDRRLLELWRAGDLESALIVAIEAGDLVLEVSPEEAIRRLVTDFCRSLVAGDDAVMLAPRRAEVADLNAAARHRLLEQGLLKGPALDVRGRAFAAGDRVVLRANDRRLGVANGSRGVLTDVDLDAGVMRLEMMDGSQRELPSWYVQQRTRAGGSTVEHAYALTAHLAQGMTTDRAFVLGSETVYRQWGYVAWSRARHGTRFYVVEPEVSEEHHTAASSGVDRFSEVVRRLDRSEAQQAAIETIGDTRAAAARHARVSYLEQALGRRPQGLLRARRWDRASRRIERFRVRYGIDDGAHALGPEPTDRMERIAWGKASRDLDRARRSLGLPGRDEHDRAISS